MTPTTDTNRVGCQLSRRGRSRAGPAGGVQLRRRAHPANRRPRPAAELTKLETRAAATAKPTEGAADLIATAERTGRSVIIVSNNSSYAILEYLAVHRIGPVAGVVGRDESDPELMKPSPYLVRAAVSILDAHPAECAFVGDSASDMLAGRLAGVPVISYANKPRQGRTADISGRGCCDNRAGRDHDRTAPRTAVRGARLSRT